MKEQDNYLHIRNTYIERARGTDALVIETELPLPARGQAEDPQFDTLLTEIHTLKSTNPGLFAAVNTVEIRHIETASAAEKDEMALKCMAQASKQGIGHPIL